MILVIVIHNGIYLNTYTIIQRICNRHHQFFPTPRCICQKVMYFFMTRKYRKMYKFKTRISQAFHKISITTHHTVWNHPVFYSFFHCIGDPFWKIRGKSWFSSCKYHSTIISFYKIIDQFDSTFITNIISITRVTTKMTSIVTMPIYLYVSYICHYFALR